MSYAVRQFFLNGGSEAWIVRIAKNADPASKTLKSDSGGKVLEVTALDAGSFGNRIFLRVDYQTDNPGSLFNLTVEEAHESKTNFSWATGGGVLLPEPPSIPLFRWSSVHWARR